MLCLKSDFAYALSIRNIHYFRYWFNRKNITRGYLSLRFIFLCSSHIHDFYCIGFFTVLLNWSTCKGNFYCATPNLIIQLIAVPVKKVNVIR